MTKELRRQIMIRDDYTCQICGKYMPDEVGLQIDHIIPVSKGGKTIPSNLQTLCSKCNGKKQINYNGVSLKGLPLYHIDRYVRETGKLFEDGSHIIYVNGNYKGDDEIGHLMQDFHQTDPDNMHYKELSQGVRHFKEVEEGRDTMCEAVQEYAKEYANEYANEKQAANVKNLMESAGFTMERALDSLKTRVKKEKQLSSCCRSSNKIKLKCIVDSHS